MDTKKKIFIKQVVNRGGNPVRDLIHAAILLFAGWGRFLIEVVIRKDFGERYFRLPQAITFTAFFALLPFLQVIIIVILSDIVASAAGASGLGRSGFQTEPDYFTIGFAYITWYGYLALFLYRSIQHHKALKRQPSVFDFARYSLDSGRINKFFYTIDLFGRKGDLRMIECYLEPAPFFFGGIVLGMVGQPFGWVLMLGSIGYSVSYVASYQWGDNYIMDKIDQMIVNEEIHNTFVEGAPGNETRGFRYMGAVPNDPEQRQRIYDFMTSDEEEEDGPVAT